MGYSLSLDLNMISSMALGAYSAKPWHPTWWRLAIWGNKKEKNSFAFSLFVLYSA
jgi:hypothetical protein